MIHIPRSFKNTNQIKRFVKNLMDLYVSEIITENQYKNLLLGCDRLIKCTNRETDEWKQNIEDQLNEILEKAGVR